MAITYSKRAQKRADKIARVKQITREGMARLDKE